ncbi:MAG: hypothetical protein C0631_19080 [Sedimenticola sp.]|nr:MAG: hypothetical protein C0631_19080 [Sedimenticola sp.]
MIRTETQPTQDAEAENKPAKTILQVKGANLLEDSLSARVILFSLLVILLVTSLMTLPLISHYSTTWL